MVVEQTYRIVEIIAACIGALAGLVFTLAYLWVRIIKGKNDGTKDATDAAKSLIDFNNTVIKGLREENSALGTRIDGLLKTQGHLESQVKTEKERGDKLEAQLQLRNPEMETFMKFLTEAANAQMDERKQSGVFREEVRQHNAATQTMFAEMVSVLKDLHKMTSGNNELLKKPLEIKSTIQQKEVVSNN